MDFFRLQPVQSPWGDYGRILYQGMSCHLPREDGLAQLERTGPFIPPMTFPGISDIIVTDDLRKKLEQSGLIGFHFAPVIKQHIIDLDWRDWNWSASELPSMPESGEPEDYILSRPHNRAVANRMPILRELVVEREVKIDRDDGIRIVAKSWTGDDFLGGQGTGYRFCTARAKQWLEREVGEWVQCIMQPTV